MSSYLAIATVTATLSDMLQKAAQAAISGAVVTNKRPEKLGSEIQDASAINLYLYQVVQSPGWVNFDLPSRTSNGQLVRWPPVRNAAGAVVQPPDVLPVHVALDLYYLLTFHGSEISLEPQRLLGSAVIALHEHPILLPADIEAAIAGRAFLAGSDLAQQVERVKLDQLNLSMEELSKLWSIFLQIPYVLSVVYRASVVLIESSLSAAPAGIVEKVLVSPVSSQQPDTTMVDLQVEYPNHGPS
jgi:hypothetical protein